MSAHYVFATVFGASDAVANRAAKLLAYELGRERSGGAVSVRVMLRRSGLDPDDAARDLMLIDPMAAVGRLTRLIGRFLIDGEAAADPAAAARAALAHAGRVVTQAQLHPELDLLLRLVGFFRGFFRRRR